MQIYKSKRIYFMKKIVNVFHEIMKFKKYESTKKLK